MKLLLPILCVLTATLTLAEVRPKPLMKDFMGINGHFQFKPELYAQTCRLVRNYHNMNWDVKTPGDPITFPHCVNKVDWNKHVYGKWVAQGFEVDLCAQFGTFGEENEQYLNLWQGQAPWIYDYGYEMAKYFGPSGDHKLVTSIEIGNEPGNDFDEALYQKLFIQMAKGIRAADPELKIVSATAQSGTADKYSKSLEETFASPEILPLYDVINLHVYAVKPKQAGQSPWDRSYPEDPRLDYLNVVDAAIAFRNQQAVGKEVWITEFGYDACTEEAMLTREGWAKKLNWTGVSDQQQAQYIVRSFFCFAERDIQRAYLYFFNDDDKASVHAASGLTRNFVPKPSFWAVKQLYENLGNYRFNRIVHKVDAHMYVYEFIHGSNENKIIWVLWSPTGVNREATLTLHDLPGELTRVEKMALENIPAKSIDQPLHDPHSLKITITESPIYLFFDMK
ncbi:hypothetical protein P3T73_15365 [Kiritimatiellota bacterium B12222]|nr:hypothetical protein P3T73_15365 [Kiritimatiellota bacterium B12222]